MTLVRAIINRRRTRCCFVSIRMASWFLVVGCALGMFAQAPQPEDHPSNPPKTRQQHDLDLFLAPVPLKSLPRNILTDQKNFWTTPFHLTQSQWQWTVPLTFVGAGLLASDTAIEKHFMTSEATASHAVTASNAGVAALVGVGAGMYLWGYGTGNDEPRETGLLAGEAGINAFLDTEALKYAFGRERPFTGDGRGLFFQGGTSFPSQHAAVSWAIASVLAHEYPGPLTQILAYGAAGGIDAARLIAKQHFATDVIVGSAMDGTSAGRFSVHTLVIAMARLRSSVRSPRPSERTPRTSRAIWDRPGFPWTVGSTPRWNG